MSKWVLFYDSADDVRAKAPAHFPAHLVRLQEFTRRGELLMVGTFADPQSDGSMAIFTTREAAEEFVEGDPFRIHQVIRAWRVLEWNDMPIAADAPPAG